MQARPKHIAFKKYLITATCCILAAVSSLKAQPQQEFAVEETTLTLTVKGFGSMEMDVLIKNEVAYLPVTVLFNYLKIKNDYNEAAGSLSGFILSQHDDYQINIKITEISYKNEKSQLNPNDYLYSENGLYLSSALFGRIFGLDCIFNFRNLSLNLNSSVNLPVFREKQQELMRQNRNKLNGTIIADIVIRRTYKPFNLGMADWSLSATQQPGKRTSSLLNLNLGGVIAGGETRLNLYHQTANNFSLRQQNYIWRYVDNENPLLRQLSLGKIPIQSTSSVLSPVIGVQLSNASTLYRKSFGSYTLSDYTSPEWTVELYINNVLIDFTKADASGFFSFQVPMSYGTSLIRLRFYGPWGEERMKEQQINVPNTFIPKNELEYTASSGILEDGRQSRFSRLELRYGISHHLTFGSGMEYLSSINNHPAIPFVNSSVLLSTNLILSADYAMGVRGRAIATYKLPAELQFELNYIRYKQGQQAILNNYLEERKAMISKTFRTTRFSGFTRLTVNQIAYTTARQTISDLLCSFSWNKISTNISTYALTTNQQLNNLYSNLSLSFNLAGRYTFRPQTQYNYREKRLTNARLEIEKQLFGNGYVNMLFENNFLYNLQNLSLGLRFDLSFMRSAFFASRSNNNTLFTQSFSGGAIYDRRTKYLQLTNQSNAGRAGLIFYAYLDLNGNAKKDNNEPKVKGLQLKINGGRIQQNTKDSSIRVFDLEPYNSYLVEMNRSSFDNIAWQLRKASYKVSVDPNQLKTIEVPVQVSGEVSGTVYQRDSVGMGKITVFIYKDGRTLVGSAITEADGYFNFIGLAPGTYTARLNPIQLGKLQLRTDPVLRNFNISVSAEGCVVDRLDFIVDHYALTGP